MRICPKCHMQVEGDCIYCPYCGYQLENPRYHSGESYDLEGDIDDEDYDDYDEYKQDNYTDVPIKDINLILNKYSDQSQILSIEVPNLLEVTRGFLFPRTFWSLTHIAIFYRPNISGHMYSSMWSQMSDYSGGMQEVNRVVESNLPENYHAFVDIKNSYRYRGGGGNKRHCRVVIYEYF